MTKKHYVHAEHCPQGCQACIDIEWEDEEEERQMWDGCSIERQEERDEGPDPQTGPGHPRTQNLIAPLLGQS